MRVNRFTDAFARAGRRAATAGPGWFEGRPAWVRLWLVAAGWAGCFPLLSTLPNHRAWGTLAAGGYLLAAAVAGLVPRRAAARSVLPALVGAVLLPLLYLALTGRAQSEVGVIERSTQLLIHTGSPYLTDPQQVTDYNPYLPGMALFGLPRAVLGNGTPLTALLGDARIWCAAALLGCLLLGRGVSGPGRDDRPVERPSVNTALAALIASPVLALPLCVSGVDLPLIGLCCLGPALATRGRYIAAGVLLALACSLKWTAWPALPVALAALAALHGARAAGRCAGVALVGAALLILPSALRTPHAMAEQVLAFPTGRAAIPTSAGSPLPGRLLSELGPWGWLAAVALLGVGAVATAVSLVRRPPLTAVACADRLALGLTLAFAFAPASRFGYLALPVVLMLWTRLSRPSLGSAAPLTPTVAPDSTVTADSTAAAPVGVGGADLGQLPQLPAPST
ncbi:glycosyltransferase 87 family protein [Kitasatospora kifunensis]|uniref:Phosphatidylinositol alpha-1,6-mannosyltransferase n=1 Tax=Kitasatospora kifunensis TaxID=58351 RepID=A0A7W7RAM8_KITKI|nr:glycosyltransferase 87 family protein [Kitasatospora kifunensis]MBB4927836.1 phosphatidylinositol alpha-1,6-mannosyltransferase [Kitasatospora kifunensis]